jgi:hypothetical protein
MKALILYVVFVAIGGAIAVGIAYVVEREISETVSLLVFLLLFFANFAVSWLGVVLVMDGSLANLSAAREQAEIERSSRAAFGRRL